MAIAELKKDLEICIKALAKMRRRQNFLEDRLEKLDGIKQKRPDDMPILYCRVELWKDEANAK